MTSTAYGSADGRNHSWAAGNLVLVGAFLGSIAVVELTAFTALVYLLTSSLARLWPGQRHISWSLYLFAFTLFWLALWKPMAGWQPLSRSAADLYYQIALFASAAVFTLLTLAITRSKKKLQ